MSKKLKGFLIGLVAVIVILGIIGSIWFPKAVKAGFPKIDGTVKLSGLDGPVDIYRDPYGIPHIYATTEHDLFFAQGYVHAQDRFWQMDFQRHQSAGRLSELLGSTTLEVDKFLRTLGWERVAVEELKNISPESLATLEAYSEGVNAYLKDHSGTQLGLEYAFLGLLNPGYEPAPWTPLNTLTWAKAMAWDLRGNMDTEITRAILLAALTPEQVDELFPPYPTDHPYIVNDQSGFTSGTSSAEYTPTLAGQITPALMQVAESFSLANDYLGGPPDAGVGSNSWAVSGDLTATGMPLLANDPHLSAEIPHIWYQVGLHCKPKNEACPLDMVGFSFPGAPSIIIGHNDRIAWGFTNVGPDVMDLYIEKINPDNPLQYEVNGEWVDMEVIVEEIRVGKDEIVEQEVRLTRHGPIITDVYGLDTLHEDSGLDLPENYAIALRWTALEPGNTFEAVWAFARAQNWEEFREAAKQFVVPAQNLLYADVDGNIAYQMPGRIPIRAGDSDGRYPVPGWTDEHEWLGYIPFEELPFAFNPSEGYIVTANNAVVDDTYPYLISTVWAYGHRAQRIVDLLEAAPGPIDIAYFQKMQYDNYNLNAEVIVPILLSMPLDDEHLIEVRAILDGWDFHQDIESGEAALFNVFWDHLMDEAFADDLPEDMAPGGGDRWFTIVGNILDDPTNPWWDNQTTEEVEDMEDIFVAAFEGAVKEIEKTLGKDPAKWQWGDLHMLYLKHGVMSNFPIIKSAFERGPFPLAGGTDMVNNTSWDTAEDNYWVAGAIPSMRMIVDLSDLSNSLVSHPVGQSGHPQHPHYIDQIDIWRLGNYIPMYWDLEALIAAAEGHLQLVP